MSGPKVVQLGPRQNEPALRLMPQDYSECQHHRFEVDRNHPRVFCRDCDELLDPYFVMRRIAESHWQRHYRVEEMKKAAERLEKQARRTQQTRRAAHLQQSDAHSIQHYQDIQSTPPERFSGDVSLTERSDGE